MTTEWKELKTIQEVAAAQAAGEEIEIRCYGSWGSWNGDNYYASQMYRSRPRKKVKVVVLREGLFYDQHGDWTTEWHSCDWTELQYFVKWLDTPERTVEVKE